MCWIIGFHVWKVKRVLQYTYHRDKKSVKGSLVDKDNRIGCVIRGLAKLIYDFPIFPSVIHLYIKTDVTSGLISYVLQLFHVFCNWQNIIFCK